MKEYENKCTHKFRALGFEVTKKTENKIEAVAAISCEKCGLFRTKILTFRRELENRN